MLLVADASAAGRPKSTNAIIGSKPEQVNRVRNRQQEENDPDFQREGPWSQQPSGGGADVVVATQVVAEQLRILHKMDKQTSNFGILVSKNTAYQVLGWKGSRSSSKYQSSNNRLLYK
jgi:hypothetical protein